MPCNHPLNAFKTGHLTENGKDELFISKGSALLINASEAEKRFGRLPRRVIYVDGHAYLYDPSPVPCGSCSGCRLERAKEWKVRCCLEACEYEHNSFITLTYDNAHCPRELVKKDLQDFFKRLRYHLGYKFRYFACGEYGEIHKRCHFHAILFGVNFDDCTFYKLVNGRPYFTSEALSRAWPLGVALVGAVDSGSIAYVTGYCEKKQIDPDWFRHMVKPFCVMSRKPGIGSAYYDANKEKFSTSPYCYGDFGSSHRFKLPRFFLNRLEKHFPEVYEELKRRRQARGEVAADMAYCESGGLSVEQIGFIQDEKDIFNRRRIDKL